MTVFHSLSVCSAQIHWRLFSVQQHICRVLICYHLSVCLSFTQVDQSNMVEVRIMQLSPESSPIPLVFAV